MHWGVFPISAAHPLLYQNYLEEPQTPVRLVKEWILMLLIKKQLTWKYIDIWCLFFHKKMSQNLWAIIMPFGQVTNILLAPKKFSFRHCPWSDFPYYWTWEPSPVPSKAIVKLLSNFYKTLLFSQVILFIKLNWLYIIKVNKLPGNTAI